MPKNKCGDCTHDDYCPYKDARRCKGDPLYSYVPKTYITEKEYLNQWEEKNEN